MELQLDLFYEIDEIEALRIQVTELKHAQDNLRKGLFKRHQELASAYLTLVHDIETMKVEIDKIKRLT